MTSMKLVKIRLKSKSPGYLGKEINLVLVPPKLLMKMKTVSVRKQGHWFRYTDVFANAHMVQNSIMHFGMNNDGTSHIKTEN